MRFRCLSTEESMPQLWAKPDIPLNIPEVEMEDDEEDYHSRVFPHQK